MKCPTVKDMLQEHRHGLFNSLMMLLRRIKARSSEVSNDQGLLVDSKSFERIYSGFRLPVSSTVEAHRYSTTMKTR